jgi:hypothetical protein
MPDRVRFGVARAVVVIGCGTANVGIVAIIASKACVLVLATGGSVTLRDGK